MKVILLSIVIVGIAMAGIAIKMFVIKGGEFKKSCGSVDAKTGKPMPCSCGHSGEVKSSCENPSVSE
jgi:hypothetical protein